jgi:ISXO2-like transposase domain
MVLAAFRARPHKIADELGAAPDVVLQIGRTAMRDGCGSPIAQWHKLMQVMKEREARRVLSGLVQLDDAYCGGKRRGKSGRGARGKRPLVAAVQTDEEGHPQRMRLSCVRGFRLREIARWSKAPLRPNTCVYSDGLWCFAAVSENGCTHNPVPMNRPDVAKRRQVLKWVDC